MAFLRRHSVLVFFALTYLISWGIWYGVSGLRQPLTGWAGLLAVIGAFGPALAGFICVGLLDGWPGVRALLGRMAAWRVPWLAYLGVLVGPFLLILLPLILNSLLGGPVPRWEGLSGLPGLFPTFLFMLIIGGLTEEPGWRGFALPALCRRHGPLTASLILGLVWGLWHWPIYSLPALGSPLPLGALVRFVLLTPLLAILFTLLAEQTQHSLLLAILFHAWNNTIYPNLPGLLRVPENDQLSFLKNAVMLVVVLPVMIGWLKTAGPRTRNAGQRSGEIRL